MTSDTSHGRGKWTGTHGRQDVFRESLTVIRLIPDKFAELGSINAVARYLRRNDIRLGFWPHYGDQRGKLQWRPAYRGTIHQNLRNPVYAGAYVYGQFGPHSPRKWLPVSPQPTPY